jgi:hypothetical protein
MDAETTGLVDFTEIANGLGAPTEAIPKEAAKPAAETKPEPEETEEPEEVAEPDAEEEGEDNEEEDDEESEEEAEPSKAVEKLTKRVDKLTARAKTAEEERDRLKTENDSFKAQLDEKPPVVVEGSKSPLDAITSLEELETRVEQAKKVRAWAKANLDGGTINSASGPKELSADEVREHLQSAEEILDSASERKTFLSQRADMVRVAKEAYPVLFDKSSPAYKRMAEEVKNFPVLLRLPHYELSMGDQMLGEMVRNGTLKLADAAEKKKPEAERKKTPIAPPTPTVKASPKSSAKPDKAAGGIKSFLQDAFGVPA